PGATFRTTTAAANRSVGETDVRPHAVDRLCRRRPEIPARPEQVDLHALAAGPGVPKFGSRAPLADPASSLSGMPRCQLKITGRTCPDIASLRCIAAVKVEARTSPRGEVS